MNKYFYIIIFLTLLVGCNSNKKSKLTPEIDSYIFPKDSTTFFFHLKPDGKETTQQNKIDSFTNSWYSSMLFKLGEPVLKDYKGSKEVYRFTWLRTFHHPIAIRLEKENDEIAIFSKICNGAGGYHPGQLISDTSVIVTSKEFSLLSKNISSAAFWELPTEQREEAGLDGSEWILEAVKNGKYQLVIRWSPTNEKDNKFRLIGETLISLAKISKEETNFLY